MLNRIKQYDWRNFNYSLIIVVILLCLISAFTVKLAGGAEDGMGFMKGQLAGMMMGLFIIAVLALIDYHFICRFVAVYYIFGLALTAATRSPIGTNLKTGAYRWIQIGGITFQPSELMKIIFILTMAVLYVKLQRRLDRFSSVVIAALVTALPTLLIMTQPDLSSSLVVLFIMVVMMFAAGTAYRILAPIVIVGIPISLVLFWYIQQPGNLLMRGYHFNRIQAWLHPETDIKQTYNWQQNLSISAIAEGKLYGKFLQDGAGEGVSRAYNSVPVNESDFIWCVIGEEFGFLGCCFVLLLLGLVIFKCFQTAKKAQDFLGMMIAVGVASMYMFQIFCNICVTTRLLPNTGLPLPFLSNGLSSMAASMIGIGLVVNIGIQPARSKKGGFTMRTAYSEANRDIDIDFEL